MTDVRQLALVVLGAVGVGLAVSAHPKVRRSALVTRLHPYLESLTPSGSKLLDRGARRGVVGSVGGLFVELVRDLHVLPRDDRTLELRLAAAGRADRPADFRAAQIGWACAAAVGLLGLATLAASTGRNVSPVPALLAAIVGAVGAFLVVDRRLDRAVEARRKRARAELPTVADLVCLCVTAGESLRGALAAVVDAGSGPVATEIRAGLGATRAGQPLADALTIRAQRLGVPAFERFIGAVLTAHDRGVPLADALRGLAAELRAAQRREVIEAAGRKQVSMLVPVIGLILPVAVVFAFFPGVVAIRVLAG